MFSRLGTFLQQGTPLPIAGFLLALMVLVIWSPVLWSLYTLFCGSAVTLLALSRPFGETLRPLVMATVAGVVLLLLFGFPDRALFPIAVLTLAPLVFPLVLALVLRTAGISLAILSGLLACWLLAQVLSLFPGANPDWNAALRAMEELRPDLFAQLIATGIKDMLEVLGTELLLMSAALTAISILLLARIWQSSLAETPFFRAEFRSIDYGKYAAAAYLVILVPAAFLWIEAPTLFGLYLALTVAFAFQAAATVHQIASVLPIPVVLLVIFYFTLLVIPQSAPILSALSALDKLFGLRQRLPLPPARPD